MSLITRCPACETLFKVVPDQLRISDGWVRCGQCEEVFDASRHLLSEAFPPTVIMDAPTTEPVMEPIGADIADFLDSLETPDEPVVPQSTPAPDDVRPEFVPEALVQTQILEVPPVSNEMSPDVDYVVDVETDVGGVVKEDDGGDPDDDQDDDDPSWGPESEPPALEELEEESIRADDSKVTREVPLARELEEIVARRSQHAPLGEYADQPWTAGNLNPAATPEPDSVPEPVELSFMQGFGHRPVWHKPLVRLGLGTIALVLLAALTVQVTIYERDRIAAAAPTARPWVSAVCEVANCSISPLRQIESIVIESSSFAKTRGDAYRFNFVIRNAAALTLAMPAVELALTDPQNRPLIRRVFLPAEFGANSEALAPGSEWAGSMAISVKLNGDAERISGYRVLAFYP